MFEGNLRHLCCDILVGGNRKIRSPHQTVDPEVQSFAVIIGRNPFRERSVIGRTAPLSGFAVDPESSFGCMSCCHYGHFTRRRNGIDLSPSLCSHHQFIGKGGHEQVLRRSAFGSVNTHKVGIVYTLDDTQ